MTQYRVGIDLGGTKTEVIVLNSISEELYRKRIPTYRDDYPRTLDDIAQLVEDAETAVGASDLPVGLGIPGTVSRKTGRVKNANSTWLNGQQLQEDISLRLKRQVMVTNDANCFAVSEATDGAGAEYDLVFAAILGTGCGGGVCYRTAPLTGPNGVGGEWGHNSLPWTEQAQLSERSCYCGRFGCQERFVSGTGLTETYRLLTGASLTGVEILAACEGGDGNALQVMDIYMEHLARAFAGVINVLDPDAIVIGGGASNIVAIYDELPDRLPRYVFGGECDTPILQAKHGDSSGVRGAAWLNPL
ncbi:ROK family protein [Gilvimarinus polysaccharolyticus]|uniref:ROK family protein n=1 Tax=Gilvimarinus polysaccharolyticus TaxID=863921 RepID=UPI000673C08F|nr:ROK family protein [Gilvimarinus polysaccharolyticus]